MSKAVKPECKEVPWHGDKVVKEYSHDAFGMVSMSVVHGNQTLFGSDLNHGQSIRIRIASASMRRGLSQDWFSADSVPFTEISLSHNQFAEFITNPNRGDGIPCTINRAPERGSRIKDMPAIDKIESKMDTMKGEVKNSALREMAQLKKAYEELAAAVEGGGGKKAMKEALFSMKCHIDNVPSNMAYVTEQAQETLAKAATDAKIEVEAYIGNAINKLGIEVAKNLGLVDVNTQGFLEMENE